MSWTRKSAPGTRTVWKHRHKAEHWYRDNQVYFLTARCRGRFPAFAFDAARAVFWDRFTHYAREFGFAWWVTTLMDNHYHTVGHLQHGESLGPMMQRMHGSVAKLVNDVIQLEVRTMHASGQTHLSGSAARGDLTLLDRQGRLKPFWRDTQHKDYMDGLLRNRVQGRRTYQYIRDQAVHAGLVGDYRDYPDTRVAMEMKAAIAWAQDCRAFLDGVPYRRYEGGPSL